MLKQKKIDKNSIQYLKYRDIALEFIKNGYSNIRAIYKRYYPKASNESIDCEAYRLLDNVRFISVLEEVYAKVNPKELELGKQALRKLYSLMNHSKKDMVQLEAAVWLGKSEAMFIDRTENKTEIIVKPDEKEELIRLRGSIISIPSEN